MEIFKICGIALLCAFMGALLGRALGGVSAVLRIAGLCAVLGGVVALAGEISEGSLSLLSVGAGAEYVSVMTKALGIALTVRICADVCRDCAENTLASAVESAGRLSMVLLALPLILRLAREAVALAEVL